jgi:leucyl aminopeptidase
MHVHLLTEDPLLRGTPLLAVPVPSFQGAELPAPLAPVDKALGGALQVAANRGDLRTGMTDRLLLFGDDPEQGPARVVLLGVGEEPALTPEVARRFAGRAVREAETLRLTEVTLWLQGWGPDRIQGAAEGAALAAWRFDELKTETPSPSPGAPRSEPVARLNAWLGPRPAAARKKALETGSIIAEAENFARTLQARPGNVATPSHLAEEAGRLAGAAGMTFTALGPAEMAGEGMGALLAVASGSDQEPRLIVLEYHGGPAKQPPLVLVGKGLTFDAGGISIKPALKMEEMKYDMSGGAAVLAAMKAIAGLGLKVNVVGIVPSSENLLNGSALKPGDVIHTRAGKTVEVHNTDAEGRLILADALSYAQEYHPRAIVDCATLTGAVVVGLGNHAAAVLGSDDDLVAELRAAGERSGERCWQLPLWDEYRRQLDSEVADLKNVGGRPAGTITAAWFLREFAGDAPWAHLDIAGTAYGEGSLSYQRPGPYGFPTRLLVEWVRSRAK